MPANYFDAPRPAPGPYHLLMPYGGAPASRGRGLANAALPASFPDYLVYVVRQSLLAFTTSLTRVSSDVHSFFLRLNQILLFDRMLRTMTAWGMPGAAQAGFAMAQPWIVPAKPQHQAMLPFWGAGEVKALPAPQTNYAVQAAQQMAIAQANYPVFAAMMAVPAAFMSFAPAMMDAWKVAI